MRVKSFVRRGGELLPVEVELSLSPGLPQIIFLGLPDTALRESALRIRAALRKQGFRLPQAQQVLVHLKPSHLRKSSRGLDLAVAAALLWETEQVSIPEGANELFFYGELTLTGEVFRPDDLEDAEVASGARVLTGPGERVIGMETLVVDELKNIERPRRIEAQPVALAFRRPQAKAVSFDRVPANLAAVIAAGEHSVLFAGGPGAGKSTLADSIPAWIEEPKSDRLRSARRLAREAGEQLLWRPVIRPHHSITPMAMIGGGAGVWSGEISRADGGVLLLDELLEFHPTIQEALRQPVENGTIAIARAGKSRSLPARLLLIGTTNLCQCGRFLPRSDFGGCRCSNAIRRRYLSRLSGPFIDRFSIFALADDWRTQEKGALISAAEIQKQVEFAIEYRRTRRAQEVPNERLDVEAIEGSLNEFQKTSFLSARPESRRRRNAWLRVARTFADLRGSKHIENQDLEESRRLCLEPFDRLSEWMA